MGDAEFKRCNMCGKTWSDLDEFLDDPSLEFIGYQANFDELELGFYIFNHNLEGCHTSLMLNVQHFKCLYSGPMFTERMTGGPECLGLCLKRDCFDRCPAQCECAFAREVMRIILDRKKAGSGAEDSSLHEESGGTLQTG